MWNFNGKNKSKEEINKILDNKDTIISSVEVSITNDKKDNSELPSYDGVDIEKKLLGLAAKMKDKSNASIMALSYFKIPKLNNNSLSILIFNQETLSEEEKNALKILGVKI